MSAERLKRRIQWVAAVIGLAGLSSTVLAVGSTTPNVCELHPNSCPINTFPIKDAPIGGCPQNACASVMPPASIYCDEGICDAYPQGVTSTFFYDWHVSNNNVHVSASGAQLFYSCNVNTSLLITVTVSTVGGGQSTAQRLVTCRRPRVGTQQMQ